MKLTADRLREVVHYDPCTGLMTRISGQCKGRVCDYLNNNGYFLASVDGKRYSVHRLVWLYTTGQFPRDEIDHANGNRTDNRWSNLRLASRKQNTANVYHGPNKHGYRGVTKHNGRYVARIRNGTQQKIVLGHFSTAAEAGVVYAWASAELKGEFARKSGDRRWE